MKKIFSAALKVSAKDQFTRLRTHLTMSAGAMWGRRDYSSPNPALVMDHGWIWRILRDILTWIGLSLRVLFGLAGALLVCILLPTLAVIRLLAIPVVSTIAAARIWFAMRKLDIEE